MLLSTPSEKNSAGPKSPGMSKSFKHQNRDGLSLLEICSSTTSSISTRSSLDDGGHDTNNPPSPSKMPGSMSRKVLNMLSPLLGNKMKRYSSAKNTQQDEQRDDYNSIRKQNIGRNSPGLLEYVNKMTISGVFCSPVKSKEPELDVVRPLSASEPTQMPSVVSPYLERLLQAAESCQLPPSPTIPAPGTPNYPTIMLSTSLELPKRMQRDNWCLHDYAVTEKLYKGYSSTVYKGICKTSGDTVVLKVYTLAAVCDLYKYQIYREVFIHSSLRHENIVHMYAAFQEGDKVVMIEEYADGCDLFSTMHKHGGRLSERLAVQLVLDPFLRVLHYLHSKGIMHRDIKPENIMFNKDMTLKLGDFGLAIDLRKERPVTRAGTLDYMAPEVLKCPFKSQPTENKDNPGLHYGPRVDSWALAVLTYELLVGFPPFFDQNRKHTEERIHTAAPSFPPGLSPQARTFLEKSLSKNPMERHTVEEMLHHPWLEMYRSRRSVTGNTIGYAGLTTRPSQASGPQQSLSPTPTLPKPPSAASRHGNLTTSSTDPHQLSKRPVLTASTSLHPTRAQLPLPHHKVPAKA